MTFVYVMECEGRVKVGLAEDVEGRRRALQSGNPATIRVVASTEAETRRHAHAVERCVHRTLSDHRVEGEWFTVAAPVALEALLAAAETTPVPSVPKPRWAEVPQPMPDTGHEWVRMDTTDLCCRCMISRLSSARFEPCTGGEAKTFTKKVGGKWVPAAVPVQ